MTRASEPAREVAAELRSRITSRALIPGERLPTARQLADECGVAVNTATRAVGMLRDEGLVVTVHGRGSFVAARKELPRGDASRYANPSKEGLAPNRAEADSAGVWDDVDMDERSTLPATSDIAGRLEIEEGDEVSQVIYRWRVGGVPTQISTQWEPLELTRGTPAEIPSPKLRGAPAGHARMASIGWESSRVSEEYRSRLPTVQESTLLEITDATPVLAVRRISYATKDNAERPVETADIVMRGDRVFIQSEYRRDR